MSGIVNNDPNKEALSVRGANGQVEDIVNITKYNGTEVFSIDKDGLTAVTGNIAQTGNIALTGKIAVTSGAAGSVPLTLTGASGQTADLFVVEVNGGTDKFVVDASGNVVISGDVSFMGTLTGALAIVGNITHTGEVHQTGSTVGTITHRITGASGQTADLLVVEQNDGTDVLKVDKDGYITKQFDPDAVTYVVWKAGSTYYAKNGATGAVDYSGASPLALLNSVFAAMPSGGDVFIKRAATSYNVDTLIIPYSKIRILMEKGTVLLGKLKIEGSATVTTSALAANANRYEATVTVADGTSFVAGDYIKISDGGADEGAPGTGSSYTGHYEGNVILSVAGNVLTLQTPINNNYTTADSALVTKMTALTDIEVVGGKIYNDHERYSIQTYWANRLTIRDVEVEPTVAGYDGTIFMCTNHSLFDHLYVHGAHDAIDIEISSCYNKVIDPICIDNEEDGIDLALHAYYNVIVNPTLRGNNDGLAIEFSSRYNECVGGCAQFSDETTTDSYGVKIFYYADHNDVHDMDISNNNGHGVYCTTGCCYNNIHDNKVHHNGNASLLTARGIYLTSGSLYNEVHDNEIWANYEHGVLISQGPGANSEYNRVYNNHVHENGVAGGAHTQDGIVTSAAPYTEIFGNRVWSHPRYEIDIYQAADLNCRVYDNVLAGTHDGAYRSNAADTKVWDNKGYVTQNSGNSVGTGAQQTIAHGLGATPNRVKLWNIDLGCAAYQSAAADGTNIYILGVLGMNYGWEALIA